MVSDIVSSGAPTSPTMSPGKVVISAMFLFPTRPMFSLVNPGTKRDSS